LIEEGTNGLLFILLVGDDLSSLQADSREENSRIKKMRE
jgi:hypothetical protein